MRGGKNLRRSMRLRHTAEPLVENKRDAARKDSRDNERRE